MNLLFIFDLDGVVYRGEALLPGVKKTLISLKREGAKICFLSNNSTLSRKGYIRKLEKMGLGVRKDELFPSSYLCALYFRQSKNINQKKVMIVGEKGLYEELKREGVKISSNPREVNYVVVGMDRKFNFRKLTLAHQAITMGASFIATNPDTTYPVEEGKTIPGAGAVVKAIEVSTGTAPLVLGKPEKFGLEIVLKQTGYSPARTILIGDRLETDIAAGNKLGIRTVLVLSGISTREEIENIKPNLQPNYTITDISELLTLPHLLN